MNSHESLGPDEMRDRKPSSKSSSRVWFWVFIAFLVGGGLGWIMGARSAIKSETIAATNQISVIDTPSNSPSSSESDEIASQAIATTDASVEDIITNTVNVTPIRPTPVTIESRELTALGDPNAPVTIVEYSDYQCPFCRRHFLETMPQIKANFIDTGQVYYVFKDFPIAGLHPLAYRLHEAALCAGQSGGSDHYWQAHDLFFDQAESFKMDSIEAMDNAILTAFEQAGISDGIQTCLESGENADLVQAGVAEAQSLGLNGTPSFFINGFPVSGAQPYALFEYAIGLAQEGTLAQAYELTEPSSGTADATVTKQEAQPVTVPFNDEPAKGQPNAPITIIEYSDYQCPFCLRHFQQTMPQLQPYIDAGQVQYLFKDFPLTNIHPQATKAHEAARCARELAGDEMYWTMHDLLFVNQESWSQPSVPQHIPVLKALAAEAGLPQAEFDECLDSDRYTEAVNAEFEEGTQLGIQGTPTFFVNGQRIVGAQPFIVFQQAIEQLLAAEE